MSSQKRHRSVSSDKLLRLLPDCKWPKLHDSVSVPTAVKSVCTPQNKAGVGEFANTKTAYYAAVDLGRMTKTAVAYYTARKGGEIASDRSAAKRSSGGKCGCCSKLVDEDASVVCTGKCGKRCHPSCGILMERREAGLKWICLKCAGVPRP